MGFGGHAHRAFPDSIAHVTENGAVVQKVYVGESVKVIPVDDIVEISFEGATLDSEQDAGEYKIVEFDGTEGFKKAYVDNRAMLLASKTGDFFTNDTILFASAYNNVKCLFYTNEEGQITRYFDGENYIIFDNDYEACPIETISERFATSTKSIGKPLLNGLKYLFTHKFGSKEQDIAFKVAEIGTTKYIENLEIVMDDPELHSQRCIVAGLSLAGALIDPIAYLTSIYTIANPNNNLAAFIDDFYGGILSSITELENEMHPDYETKHKYAQFYANKYNVLLSAEPPTDRTATSAILNGSLYTEDGMRGNLYFRICEMFGDGDAMTVPVTKENSRINEWAVNGFKSALKPNKWYYYYLVYEFTVDKLVLELTSESVDLYTLELVPYAGEAYNITSNSAVIDCKYTNAEDFWCGLRYYTEETENSPSEKGAISVNSEKKESIILTDLLPDTEYYYYAIIDYGEGEEISQIKYFKTATAHDDGENGGSGGNNDGDGDGENGGDAEGGGEGNGNGGDGDNEEDGDNAMNNYDGTYLLTVLGSASKHFPIGKTYYIQVTNGICDYISDKTVIRHETEQLSNGRTHEYDESKYCQIECWEGEFLITFSHYITDKVYDLRKDEEGYEYYNFYRYNEEEYYAEFTFSAISGTYEATESGYWTHDYSMNPIEVTKCQYDVQIQLEKIQ